MASLAEDTKQDASGQENDRIRSLSLESSNRSVWNQSVRIGLHTVLAAPVFCFYPLACCAIQSCSSLSAHSLRRFLMQRRMLFLLTGLLLVMSFCVVAVFANPYTPRQYYSSWSKHPK